MKALAPFLAAALLPFAAGADDRAALSAAKQANLQMLEQEGRAMVKDYPDRDAGYELLLDLLPALDAPKAAELGRLLDNPQAPDSIKPKIAAYKTRLAALGRPLALKFTALDGRAVDLAALKGKVVLLDFWATWCGPCVAKILRLKEAHEKLASRGFEIVGINFDSEKETLQSFVKARGISWPQSVPGSAWQEEFTRRYGINPLPVVWLVDRKGNLVDVDAKDDFEAKIEKLLAE